MSPEQAAPILDEIGGFPLGLVLAAPLVELADGEPLGLTTDPNGPLHGVLRETLALCQPEERDLLSVASCFAVAPALDDLTELAGLPRTNVLRALHGLRSRGLVRLAEGTIDVPVAIARLARTDAHRRAHARWAGRLLAEPVVLRRRRHELEHALTVAEPDTLPHVLLRHIVTLFAYGPREQIREEGLALLPRIDHPARRSVLLGMILQGSDRRGASDAFDKALSDLPDDDVELRAFALMLRSVNATWSRDHTVAIDSVEPMLALRERVSDRAVWASLTNNAASLVSIHDEARACALLSEVDQAFEELPTLAITAAFYRLGIEVPSASSVAWVEQLVSTIGAERLGPHRWHSYHLRLGRAWIRVGEVERGQRYLDEHEEAGRHWDPSLVDNILTMAAIDVLDQPETARSLLERVMEPSPLVRAVHWFLDGAEGPVPVSDPGLVALWEAFRDGEPLAMELPWTSVARTLSRQRTTVAS